MSAPVGGSLRVPSFVVVGLLLAAIGVRPGSATGQAPPTPPVPDKSMPVPVSNCQWTRRPSPPGCCTPFSSSMPAGVSNEVAHVKYATRWWMDGELYHVTIGFKDQAGYNQFLNQTAIMLHKPKNEQVWYTWRLVKLVSERNLSYHLIFYACKKNLAESVAPQDGKTGGTGTGTVIIVTNPNTAAPTFSLASSEGIELEEIQ